MMPIKKTLQTLALASLMTTTAFAAEDLEALLDGKGQEVKTEKGAVAAPAAKEQTVLVDVIRDLLASRVTSEQNVFFRHLEVANWEKSLLQYQAAFGGTAFERSENGRALLSLLKFKAGLTSSGLESLLTIQNPKKIHLQILNQIRDAAGEKNPVWKVAQLSWSPAWAEVFGLGFEIRSKTKDLNFKNGINELKALSQRAPSDSPEKALAEWHLALAYSLNDQADLAAKIMAGLSKSKHLPVSEELLNLTAARLLYQNGYFDAAIKYYGKVSKNSDYWLDAQEEIAWSYIRKGEPQNSLAVTQTLVNPIFKGQVGAESYFLRALSQLKICDYPGVVKSLQAFPVLFKDRNENLKKLSTQPETETVKKVLAEMRVKKLKAEDLGTRAHELPRLMPRDQKLQDLLLAQSELEREAHVSEEIYARSLAQTGLQASFEKNKNDLLARAKMAKASTLSRVQHLAKVEVEETRKILAKMHIVEAEVIQQTAMADKLAKTKTKEADVKVGSTGSKSDEVLRFVGDNQEVWFDELSNYQINVKKACQVR